MAIDVHLWHHIRVTIAHKHFPRNHMHIITIIKAFPKLFYHLKRQSFYLRIIFSSKQNYKLLLRKAKFILVVMNLATRLHKCNIITKKHRFITYESTDVVWNVFLRCSKLATKHLGNLFPKKLNLKNKQIMFLYW